MLFNSVLFLFFFIIVYGLHSIITIKYRKYLLLFSSILFYSSWDFLNLNSKIPYFLIHFLFVIFINYLFVSIFQSSAPSGIKKAGITLIIILNIFNLAFFKYFYFIIEIIGLFMGHPEWQFQARESFHIILPIAISFYTFQIISFQVDKYRGLIPETTSLIDFSLYVMFFPQQLAGPILKSEEFFPRLYKPIEITKYDLELGLYHIFLGITKKVIFADSIAFIVDPIFANPLDYNYQTVLLAIIGFSFQLWGDFSGYSDIAVGCGKLLGYDFPNNFDKPFYSARFSEMWTRWHITLSRFLREYIYFPLGGSRKGEYRASLNFTITMVIAGVWHGANWNYLLWGGVVASSLVIEKLILDKFNWWRNEITDYSNIFKIIIVSILWLILVAIFRVNSLNDLQKIYHQITTLSGGKKIYYEEIIFLSASMMVIQYYEHKKEIFVFLQKRFWLFSISASILLLFLLTDLSNKQVQFIYFQF